MGWFSRKEKPERRYWCPQCKKIMVKEEGVKEYDGTFSHRLWRAQVIEGVDFGSWEWHSKLLAEDESAPHRTATADGRLSLSGGGEVSLAENK